MKKLVTFILINYAIFLYPLIMSMGAFVWQDVYVMILVFSVSLLIEATVIRLIKNRLLFIGMQVLCIVINLFYFYFVLAPFNLLPFVFIILGVLAVFGVFYKINSNKTMLTFLLIFLAVAFISANRELLAEQKQKVEDESGAIKRGKRNIYFIGLDALVSNRFFTKFFDSVYEVPKLLNGYGFSVADVTSPGSLTLETYARLIAGSNTITPRLYKEVIANRNSPLYRELRSAGYKKAFIYQDDYFGTDPKNVFEIFAPKQNTYCNFCTYIDDRWGFGFCKLYKKNMRHENGGELVKADALLKNAGPIFKDSSKWFLINHIWYPGHSEQTYNCNDTAQFNAFRTYYINSQATTESIITTVFEYLRKNDPDPVIVFMGDHGSFLFRNAATGNSKNTFSENDQRLDHQDVLLAIYPKTVGDNIVRKLKDKNNTYKLFTFLLEE